MSDADAKSDERAPLTVEQARELLDVTRHDDGSETVHAIRRVGPCVLLGADWPLADVLRTMYEHGVERAAGAMAAVGHGVVSIDERSPVFFATVPR